MTTYNDEGTEVRCNSLDLKCNSMDYDLSGILLYRGEQGGSITSTGDGYGPELYADNMAIDADTTGYYADGANAYWNEVAA